MYIFMSSFVHISCPDSIL